MSSLLFVDIESTGLSSNAAIIEIALIPVINGEKKDPFVSYVRPHAGATIEEGAFKINKIDPKKIWDFPEAEGVVSEIIKYLDQFETIFTIVAHNADFDSKFVTQLFNRTGNYSNYVSRFSTGTICTLKLSKAVLATERKKPSKFNLGELSKFFGIKLENAHTALADIEATVLLYEKLEAISENKLRRNQRALSYQEQRAKYCTLEYYQYSPTGSWISQKAQEDKEAMRFICEDMWNRSQTQPTISYDMQESVQHGEDSLESWDVR